MNFQNRKNMNHLVILLLFHFIIRFYTKNLGDISFNRDVRIQEFIKWSFFFYFKYLSI